MVVVEVGGDIAEERWSCHRVELMFHCMLYILYICTLQAFLGQT